MKNWYIKKKEAEVMEGLEELKDFAKKLDLIVLMEITTKRTGLRE